MMPKKIVGVENLGGVEERKMDALHVEKVNALAKSLYDNRLVSNMEEAAKMAEHILSGPQRGESRSVQELVEEVPAVERLSKENISADVSVQPREALKIRESITNDTQDQTLMSGGSESELSNKDSIDALKRIVGEETDRIASLKEELDNLKAQQVATGKDSTLLMEEIHTLAEDIDRSKGEIEHIREHVKDVEGVKQAIEEVEESQDRLDDITLQAQQLKEDPHPALDPYETGPENSEE